MALIKIGPSKSPKSSKDPKTPSAVPCSRTGTGPSASGRMLAESQPNPMAKTIVAPNISKYDDENSVPNVPNVTSTNPNGVDRPGPQRSTTVPQQRARHEAGGLGGADHVACLGRGSAEEGDRVVLEEIPDESPPEEGKDCERRG